MIHVGEVECLRNPNQIAVFRFSEATALDLTIQNLAAELDRSVLLLDAEALPDLVPRASRPNVRQPIPTRLRRRRRYDLDRLGVLQLARETRNASIDSRALTVDT